MTERLVPQRQGCLARIASSCFTIAHGHGSCFSVSNVVLDAPPGIIPLNLVLVCHSGRTEILQILRQRALTPFPLELQHTSVAEYIAAV